MSADRLGTFFLYDSEDEFSSGCCGVLAGLGFARVPSPQAAYLSVAPRLSRIIPDDELAAPQIGALVFHPSALPYRRGPDAIRWTVAAGERVSAATWFWADSGIDTGPVCEQEVVVLMPGESPGRAYHTRFVPAGLRALRRAMIAVKLGTERREPQDNSLATYDSKWDGGSNR